MPDAGLPTWSHYSTSRYEKIRVPGIRVQYPKQQREMSTGPQSHWIREYLLYSCATMTMIESGENSSSRSAPESEPFSRGKLMAFHTTVLVPRVSLSNFLGDKYW